MNTPRQTKATLADQEFATFWRNFDPNQRYTPEAQTFIRTVWDAVRKTNIETNLKRRYPARAPALAKRV
jgi:outer membrane protein assembly factor BamD (BamD/ComL family)